MSTFDKYLKGKKYSTSSIEGYLVTIHRFESWLYKKVIPLKQVNYGDIIDYIKSLQQRQIKQRTIQQYISVINNYFNFLIYTKQYKKQNPLSKIKVQGVGRSAILDILSEEELNCIYESYSASGIRYERNLCMLGLIIYQGLGTRDLIRLSIKDIDLFNQFIFISSSKRSNERKLILSEDQVGNLNQYLNQGRERIVKRKNLESETLFLSNGRGFKLKNSIQNMLNEIRLISPRVHSVNHLRASVISNWTKKYNLREVQYMAGHKYVSSTEHYQQQNLDNVHDDIIKFHPIVQNKEYILR